MKKFIPILALCLAALPALFSCDDKIQEKVPVSSVVLSSTSLDLVEGDEATLTATVSPADASDKSVSWRSSNEQVATVSGGRVKAVAPGNATITATAGDRSATCSVKVGKRVIAVTSVTLDKKTLKLEVGETATLTATVKPDDATDKTVTWSSLDKKVATVENGKVTAVKAGTAVIMAQAGEKSDMCNVTVEDPIIAVSSIELDKTTLTLTEGETATLKATVKPDNATDKTVTWSSNDPKVATVKDGKVTAVKAGTAKITAKAGEKTVTCSVTVKAPVVAVTSVTLDKTTLSLAVGGTYTLTATVKPDNATDKTVTWSTNDTKVAVVKDGKVTGVKPGTAKITAKAGEKSAVCTVTVTESTVAVTSVTLDKTTLSLKEGESATLTATVKPDNATDKTVTWSSSNAAVATVKDGKVTGVKAGTAKITAKAGDKTATCSVTVTAGTVAVTSVELDKTTLTLAIGESYTLTATVKPDNATDKTVTWSSNDPKVATVKDGKVTAVKAGTAKITAKAGTKTAVCNVTVSEAVVPVTSISLDKKTLSLAEGESYTLTATVKPDNATDKTVTWSTNDTKVAIVKDGKVTAVKAGTAKITAKAGEKSAVCTVTVTAGTVAVTSVELDKTTLSLAVGGTYTLTATVKPDNATDKTVTWSSSNTAVATVKDGKVTGVKAGTAKITAKAGDKTATCSVTVTAGTVAVTSVTLDKTTLSLAVGGTYTLTATVKPDNATDKTVTWSSSNTAVATVKDGKVTGVKAGTAKITAKAGDKSATCSVTVTAATVAVTSVTLNKTTLSLEAGDSYTLSATVKPDDATDKTVTWSSSNTAVATVKDGTVTAVKAGTAKITAKAGGKSATCSVTVTETVVPVNSVTLDRTEFTMTEKTTANLRVTVLPMSATDKTVTWSSSNTAVATVKSNEAFAATVTAVKAGTAKITATAGGKSATCTVTVKAGSVGNIVLDCNEVTTNYAEKYISFYAHFPDGTDLFSVAVYTDNSDMIQHLSFDQYDGEVMFMVTDNNDQKTRQGTITVQSGSLSAKCVVKQTYEAPSITIIPNPMTLTYAVQRQTFTVQVTNPRNNMPFYILQDGTYQDWLGVFMVGNTPTIQAGENNTGKDRSATVVIGYADKRFASVKVPVKQMKANTAINTNPASISCDYQAQTVKLDVLITDPLTNVYLDAEENDSWFRVTSMGDDWLDIRVEENQTASSRTSSITLTYGTLTRDVTITQKGKSGGIPEGFVDLGLTSGTLWARTNLGATKETQVGNYYAWGETAPKASYTEDNYKFWSKGAMTKYNATDGKTTLDPEDDAAYKTNSTWSMPTKAQLEELERECDWEYVRDPIPGAKVKSRKNDAFIFFPTTGYIWEKDVEYEESGYFWSKDLFVKDPRSQAYILLIIEDNPYQEPRYRGYGMPIRPVTKK